MEFRWIALLAVWTLLSGPMLVRPVAGPGRHDPPPAPAPGSNARAVHNPIRSIP